MGVPQNHPAICLGFFINHPAIGYCTNIYCGCRLTEASNFALLMMMSLVPCVGVKEGRVGLGQRTPKNPKEPAIVIRSCVYQTLCILYNIHYVI
jgi:hypothetical protein